MVSKDCPFCTILATESRPLLDETVSVVAFEDAFPSTLGHTLVIPRRHVGRVLELSSDEAMELWQVARRQLARLEAANAPDAFTIGVNDGEAAGQTVPHVHLHVMPRQLGDTPEARGGIRWVVPKTASYWEP